MKNYLIGFLVLTTFSTFAHEAVVCSAICQYQGKVMMYGPQFSEDGKAIVKATVYSTIVTYDAVAKKAFTDLETKCNNVNGKLVVKENNEYQYLNLESKYLLSKKFCAKKEVTKEIIAAANSKPSSEAPRLY